MITYLVISTGLTIIAVLFAWLPTVSELPFGNDYWLQFTGTIAEVRTYSELFDSIWSVFLIAMGFAITLWTIEWVIKIWRMIRG